MRPERSIVVIDSSCLDHLRDETARRTFSQNMRAAQWTPYASALNLLEAYKAKGDLRRRLLETIGWIRNGRRLLPMPHDILRAVGEAVEAGEDLASIEPTGIEASFSIDDAEEEERVSEAARRILEREEAHFRETHHKAWESLRSARKDLAPSDRFIRPGEFLDRVWMRPEHVGVYVEAGWEQLGFSSDAPVDALLQTPTWRLYLEAWGIGAYRQAFRANRQKGVGWVDVMQLVYLGAAPRRMFVVFEEPLREAGKAVFRRRHLRAQTGSIVRLTAPLD